jgi:hypothetical protein
MTTKSYAITPKCSLNKQWVHEMLGTPWAAEVGKDGVMRIIDKDGVLGIQNRLKKPRVCSTLSRSHY